MGVLTRRALALGLLAITEPLRVSAQRVRAAKKTIDRRVRTEGGQFGLTFAAKRKSTDSLAGHAFVIWQRESDAVQMSVSEAIGFYPSENSKKYSVVLGGKGALRSDQLTDVDLSLTVLVNEDQFKRALAVKQAWRANGTYSLLWANCRDHVADIARSIGLNAESRLWTLPEDFLLDLLSRNH